MPPLLSLYTFDFMFDSCNQNGLKYVNLVESAKKIKYEINSMLHFFRTVLFMFGMNDLLLCVNLIQGFVLRRITKLRSLGLNYPMCL